MAKDAGASWSINVQPFSTATTVTFAMELYDSSGNYIDYVSNLSPTQVHNSAVSGISLNVDYSSVTLSGTIGTVTVNGATPDNIYVSAYNQNGNYLGSIQSQSGAWTINIPTTNTNLASTTSIKFQLEISINGGWLYHDIPGTHSYTTGQSISNIALGNVSITSVTLSGTIGTVTVNSATPDRINVRAYNQSGYYLGESQSQNGAWTINILSTNTNLASTTSISFRVEIYTNGGWLYHDIPGTHSYTTGQSISNITLGDVSVTSVTLSGTIGTVIANGVASDHFWIRAYNQNVIRNFLPKFVVAVAVHGD